MQLTWTQAAAVVAAAAVMLWPQITAMAARVPALGLPKPTPGEPDRSAWVTQLLALQDATRNYGHPKAAALIGQAVVDLVSTDSEKPPSLRGGKP